MILREYYQIRSDINYKSLSLTQNEVSAFKIPDLNKGWIKKTENIEIPDEIILKTIDVVLTNPNVSARIKGKLSTARSSVEDNLKLRTSESNFSIGYEFLYIAENELGMIKIGVSKTPQLRAKRMTDASGLKCELLAYYRGAVPSRDVERSVLMKFSKHRAYGEWFKANTITREMIEGIFPDSYVTVWEA